MAPNISTERCTRTTDKGAFEDKTPEQQQYMLNEHGVIAEQREMVLLDKLLQNHGSAKIPHSQMVKIHPTHCEFRTQYERPMVEFVELSVKRQSIASSVSYTVSSFCFHPVLVEWEFNLTAAGKCHRR
jgi:hypothetical protein